jgi:ferric-dicitrate binding protein FerR (iron transport regulator)
MTDREQTLDPQDEATVAALLRAAGPRLMPSAEATAAARAAVEAEWRDAVRPRALRRAPASRYATWAAAAGVTVAALALWLVRSGVEAPGTTVASIVRLEGGLQASRGDGRWTTLAASDTIGSDTELRTAPGGRAALRLASGVELRLDAATRIALESAGRARLEQGAVYVDSGSQPGPPSTDLLLETPVGRVRHLGTQYLARVEGARLTVGVREGRVAIEAPSVTATGGAGEQLAIADHRLERTPLSPTAADWQWIGAVTPPLRLDGRTVEEFLVWAARETGRSIVYASPEAGRQARSVTLSGTVEGLAPDAAVAAVLSTTSLRPQIGTAHIRIDVQPR